MSKQHDIMRKGGYIPATEACELVGYAHVSSIHRLVDDGKVEGTPERPRYVKLDSLAKFFSDNPPIHARILAEMAKSEQQPSPQA